MGILDQIRNTTVADLERVTGDFSDVAPAIYRPRVEKEMVRIVEGATHLRPAVTMPNLNAGMVTGGKPDTRPFKDQQGLPTERQQEFIASLMIDLANLDESLWQQACDYMYRMNEARAWTPARGGNVSRWIDHLKAKVAELRTARPKVQVKSDWLDIPTGYYALQDGDSVKFYRVNHHKNGRTYLDACASDDRHPILNAVHKKNILTAIRAVRMGGLHRTVRTGDRFLRAVWSYADR